MKRFRLSKYSPSMRDADGRFLGADWTSSSDIGRKYNDEVLTLDTYLHVESAYVESVRALLVSASIEKLRVSSLEVCDVAPEEIARFGDDVYDYCAALSEGELVIGRDIEKVVRGALREMVWCKLTSGACDYVHFGYDFYLYVGVRVSEAPLEIPAGIYLEDCPSPYDEHECNPDT